MAGLFAAHKQVLCEAPLLQATWKGRLKLTQSNGPELANSVSRLESLISIFNRERELLFKLLFSKNNQMRTFKFWQLTRQVNAHLKATNIESIISLLQSTHLQFSQGKKIKKSTDLSFVLAFLLHQLRSHHWIYMETCAIIKLAYDLYCGTVELSHWMPLSLSMMAVLSRLHLLCIRFSVIIGSVYNSLSKHFSIDHSVKDLLKNDWELWTGELNNLLEIPEEVEWQDFVSETDSKNQEAIDSLNRDLERANDTDDLGEAIAMEADDSPLISSSLLYNPTASPLKPSSSILASKSAPIVPKAITTNSPSTNSRPMSIPSASKQSLSEKHKEKLKEKHKDKKLKEKRKEKSSSSSSAHSPLAAPSAHEKHKSHNKDKKRTQDLPPAREETKKRKSNSSQIEDEIDDLFGLLTPDTKKSKHR